MSKLFSASLLAGAAAAVYTLKKKIPDPASVASRAVNAVKLNVDISKEDYGNGVALTPPMGWSSWNLFRNKINEDLIYETGKAMRDSGLAECGYTHLNIDDCWQSSLRDANGRLQGDFITFPSGIKNLVERVNALGLKLGIYSSNGTLTCEDLPASLGNEAIDADTFAEWGIEYFKYDFCHNQTIPFRAPQIEKITISKGGLENETEYLACEAFLSGNAHIEEDDRLPSGKYITGLGANGGAAEFTDVYVPEDGEYILTLCLMKKSNSRKYCEILVNGEDRYTTIVPPTHVVVVTAEGRHQVKVNLKAGKNIIKIYNPIASRIDSACTQYTNMGKELRRATKEYAEKTGQPEKPIVYSICEWGMNMPWKWGYQAGNLWRTTMDIKPVWSSILGLYEFNVNLYKYAGPGHWNDPDMLEVGNGELSYEENKTHFTLWCMMAAPLILGNDLRDFIKSDGTPDTDNLTYRIVTNRDVIAIDQDRLGMQCRRVKTNGINDVLVKPLENNEIAVCLFNKSGTPCVIEHSMSDIVYRTFVNLQPAEEYEAYELWDKTTQTVTDKISASVPAHGVKVYRIKVK